MGHTSVKHEKYEPKIMAMILMILQNAAKLNQPRFFEIYVNHLMVVPKTYDIEQLESYQDYINEETTLITIYVYHYNQKSSDKYFLHITPESLQQAKAKELGGLAVNTMDEDALREKWERDKHYEALIEENRELTTEVEVLEKALEKAEKEIELVRQNRDKSFTEKVGQIVDGVSQSGLIKKLIPGIDGMKEFFNGGENGAEGNLSGRQEEDEEQEEDIQDITQRVLSTEEEKHLLLLKDIKTKIGSVNLASIMFLLDLLSTSPSSIDAAIKIVKNQIAKKQALFPDATGQEESEFN